MSVQNLNAKPDYYINLIYATVNDGIMSGCKMISKNLNGYICADKCDLCDTLFEQGNELAAYKCANGISKAKGSAVICPIIQQFRGAKF